jgi:hypothetical protein
VPFFSNEETIVDCVVWVDFSRAITLRHAVIINSAAPIATVLRAFSSSYCFVPVFQSSNGAVVVVVSSWLGNINDGPGGRDDHGLSHSGGRPYYDGLSPGPGAVLSTRRRRAGPKMECPPSGVGQE